MVSFITLPQARNLLRKNVVARRLQHGLTQAGLAQRAGVPLATLRKFEQKGLISLESFLKLLIIVGGLEAILKALAPPEQVFSSIDEVLQEKPQKERKRGWRR